MRIRFKLPIRWPHPTVAFCGVIYDMTIENPAKHSDRKKSGTIWSMELTSQLHQLSCRTSSTACSCETALIHCTHFQRNSFGMCRRHGQKMKSTLAQHWVKLNHPMSQPNLISLLRPSRCMAAISLNLMKWPALNLWKNYEYSDFLHLADHDTASIFLLE